MKKLKLEYVKWILAAVVVLVLALSSTLFMAQHKRMNERKKEQQELIKQQEELELEKERLKLLAQYVGTESYAEYYARYRLGYMASDEVCFEK